jgi:hypothetical protein
MTVSRRCSTVVLPIPGPSCSGSLTCLTVGRTAHDGRKMHRAQISEAPTRGVGVRGSDWGPATRGPACPNQRLTTAPPRQPGNWHIVPTHNERRRSRRSFRCRPQPLGGAAGITLPGRTFCLTGMPRPANYDLHHGLGALGHCIPSHKKGTASPSATRMSPTSRPFALSRPHVRARIQTHLPNVFAGHEHVTGE